MTTALGFVRLATLLLVGFLALVFLALAALYASSTGSDAQVLACGAVDSVLNTFSIPLLLVALLAFFVLRSRWGFRPWKSAGTTLPVTGKDWALWLAAIVLALSATAAITGALVGARC